MKSDLVLIAGDDTATLVCCQVFAIGAIGVYSGADLARLAEPSFDVSLNTLAKCGMEMPREVTISSPRPLLGRPRMHISGIQRLLFKVL